MKTPIRLRTELAKTQADSAAFTDIGHLHWQTQIYVGRGDFEAAAESLRDSFKEIRRLKDPGLVVQAKEILNQFYEDHRADFEEVDYKRPKAGAKMLPPPKKPSDPEVS